jgi:ATP-dependent protease HslVU (ClpYQ) peptidase subunit
MAADSQSTAGPTKSQTPRPKVQRIHGHLLAAVGRTDAIPSFFEWYQKGCPKDQKPELGESFEAMVLTPEGLYQYYERLEAVEVVEEFWAIGQGSEIALGAMGAGATPERAVEIACEFNIYTGLPVVVERLHQED